MANSPLLALACLAVLVASAAGCNIMSMNQTGTLEEQVPKGCLSTKKVQEALMDLIKPACFDAVMLNFTNSTGADCEDPGTIFNVSFANPDCFDGALVGGGEMTPTAGGNSSIEGEFATGQSFSGTSTPAGLFTVTVTGMDCKLVYTTENVGQPNIITTGASATGNRSATGDRDASAGAAATATPSGDATTATTANTPTRSSAVAAAVPAALMALVAGALALAF